MENRNKVMELINPKIANYMNKTELELKEELSVTSKAKSIKHILISRIIDLKNLDLETTIFLRDNTVFKTVTLDENGKTKEHMSFPSIDYYNMIKNNWEKSAIYKYFSNKTISIFVFQKEENDSTLIDVKYYKLNSEDLNEIKKVWSRVKEIVLNDEIIIGGKHGFSVENFPGVDYNEVSHIRPHDQNSSAGRVLLPNGKRIINYCFWLNKRFIDKILYGGKE